MTDELKGRIEAAMIDWIREHQYSDKDRGHAFKAGAQYMLDNPPPEWVKRKDFEMVHARLDHALEQGFKLMEKAEALVRTIEGALNKYDYPGQALSEIRTALSAFAFRKAKG